MLISVIIPCYNHSSFLNHCINSIRNQIDHDVEIIVVDDGSTDNSVEVAQGLGVRVIQQRNAGPAAARNSGLAQASGKYLAFLDADDTWLPGFASTMLCAMERAGDQTAGVVCGWQFMSTGGTRIGPPRLVDAATLRWSDLVLGNKFPIHAALVRSEVVKHLGGFDENIIGVEDWDLWLRVLNGGSDLSTVNAILVAYRMLEHSVSGNIYSMFENSLKVVDKAFLQRRLPAPAAVNRDKAYAWRYLDLCAGLYANREDQHVREYFERAVALWPEVLRDRHTLYTLVCARQPTAYKTTRDLIDLTEAEARTKDLLLSFGNVFPDQVCDGLVEMYDVLAQCARVQQNGAGARHYALRAACLGSMKKRLSALCTWSKTWFDRWRKGGGFDRLQFESKSFGS